MRLLITGVAGFIGRHAAQYFAARGWTVYGLDHHSPENVPGHLLADYCCCRLPCPEAGDFLAEVRPEAVLHAAGRASPVLSLSSPVDDYSANTRVVLELLETIRKAELDTKFLLLSSAAVYGQPQALPIGEDCPLRPLSPYGFHKWQAELLCREYSEIYGVRSAVLRIFSAYGPGLRRQVIYDLICRAMREKGLRIAGTGEETRDFIHVADLCLASEAVLLHDSRFSIFNAASGQESRIADLADIISNELGLELPPVFDGAAQRGVPQRWRADISKLKEIGFIPTIPIQQGLRESIAWCKAGALH